MWFSFFLPGLVTLGAPIPLGGTSNHFRRSSLRALGGWDPPTSRRTATSGSACSVSTINQGLESVTLEEANSDFVNWAKQRSRWYKGYLQTFLIHLRSPETEEGDRPQGHSSPVGLRGGPPILAIVNPVFWIITLVWFVAQPLVVKEIFPAPVYYAGLVLWALGIPAVVPNGDNSTPHQSSGPGSGRGPRSYLLGDDVQAALKAMWQLLATPSFWEKKAHGLDTDTDAETPEPLRLVS